MKVIAEIEVRSLTFRLLKVLDKMDVNMSDKKMDIIAAIVEMLPLLNDEVLEALKGIAEWEQFRAEAEKKAGK